MMPLTKTVWAWVLILYCLIQIKGCACKKIEEIKGHWEKEGEQKQKQEEEAEDKTTFLQNSDAFEVTLKDGLKAAFVIG